MAPSEVQHSCGAVHCCFCVSALTACCPIPILTWDLSSMPPFPKYALEQCQATNTACQAWWLLLGGPACSLDASAAMQCECQLLPLILQASPGSCRAGQGVPFKALKDALSHAPLLRLHKRPCYVLTCCGYEQGWSLRSAPFCGPCQPCCCAWMTSRAWQIWWRPSSAQQTTVNIHKSLGIWTSQHALWGCVFLVLLGLTHTWMADLGAGCIPDHKDP